MATATVPPRPSVPANRPAPPSAPPKPAAQAPVQSAPAAPVAAVAAIPTGATENVAPTVPGALPETKKKRGRKAGSKKALAPYFGLFVYDEAGQPVYDTSADGGKSPRTKKLDTMPPLDGELAFDSNKHEPLKASQFDKTGDFFRHKAQLLEKRIAQLLKDAKDADEGKSTSGKAKLEKATTMVQSIAKGLVASLGWDAAKTFFIAQGISEEELAQIGVDVGATPAAPTTAA